MKRFLLLIITLCYFCQICPNTHRLAECLSPEDAITLFTKSPAEIKRLTALFLSAIKKQKELLLNTINSQQTFFTMMKPIDVFLTVSNAAIMRNVCEALSLIHPNKKVAHAAKNALRELQNSFDRFLSNPDLYRVCKEYSTNSAESLSEQEKYFIKLVQELFERRGAHLPSVLYQNLIQVKKELVSFEQLFLTNVDQSHLVLRISSSFLKGIEKKFLLQWPHDEEGIYTIPLNQRNYMILMRDCVVEQTRKNCFLACAQKAYPENEKVLKKVIVLRNKYAQILGFKNYAEFDIANQMAHTSEQVQQFLDKQERFFREKWDAEFKKWIKDLPEEITLTTQGALNPWDIARVKAIYDKKYKNSLGKIEEYFPLEKTVQNIFNILEHFYTIRFTPINTDKGWDQTVKLLQITDDNNIVRGYLFLDLLNRPRKVKGSRTFTVVPATGQFPGVFIVSMSLFPTFDKKSILLNQDRVRALMHELGHVIHRMLYKGSIISFAQKGAKDFTEIMSQLQSFWSLYTTMLAQKARHYTTNKPMPPSMLKALRKSQQESSYYPRLVRHFYAQLSLDYFGSDSSIHVQERYKTLYKKMFPQIIYSDQDHRFASYTNFITYGAKNYCYLWSKALALDLFSEIKKYGLTNPIIGKKYVDEVLSKGWSQDPYQLLKNFLGHEPRLDLFVLPN